MESGSVNLFERFSALSSDDRSLYYNPEAPYTEIQFHEIKNTIDKCKKKSSSTKIKSLNKLVTACNEATDYTLFIDMLPNWVYLFSTLTKFEAEKAVREAAFKTQIVFFSKFKKSFAKYLDEIFTPLWLGRCDPSREVAESAKRAFSAAFPEDRQPKVIEKCFERYMRESLSILREDIKEKEEINERLMSSAILGIKEAIEMTDTILPQITPLYESLPVWNFTASNYLPMVRSASIFCINTFLNKEILQRDHYIKMLPLIFGLIKDKNRLVHQALWDQTFLNYLGKFPEFKENIDTNNVIKDLCTCLINGAYGAGPVFYPQLVKFLSFLGKEKLCGKKTIENLFLAILKGFNSDDGNFHGKFILNAYYEVVVFVSIKLPEKSQDLNKFILEPANMYLQSQSLITPIMHLNVVPGLLGQTLGYLEQRGIFPEISEYLYQLSYGGLQQSPQVAIAFLKDLKNELSSKGPQCRSLIRNLIHIMHSQISQDIENKFTINDHEQLKNKLNMLLAFTEISSSLDIPVYEWWNRGINEKLNGEILVILVSLLKTDPKQWWRAILQSKNSYDELLLLIPEGFSEALIKAADAIELEDLVISIVNSLKESTNLAISAALIDILSRISNSKLITLIPLSTKIRKNVFILLELQKEEELSLQEVMNMWKESLEKEKNGEECCFICCRANEINEGHLPDHECISCRNKVHRICLENVEAKEKCLYCEEKFSEIIS